MIEIKFINTTNLLNEIQIFKQLLRVNSSESVSKQCDINQADEWTALPEEIAKFRQADANIEMNDPSVPRLFHINFKDQVMPH